MRKFFKQLWTKIRSIGEPVGFLFLLLGVLVLITQAYLIVQDSQNKTDLTGIWLGLFSVGLGCIAIDLSEKADKKYTEILNEINTNTVSLLNVFDRGQDMIEQPIGNVIVKPPTAALALETFPPEVTVEKRSKEAAQKRLDEDTRKVGYVRGEIYQLEDGSWGIHWGGKYPL